MITTILLRLGIPVILMSTSASLGWVWHTSATVRDLAGTVERMYEEGTLICKRHDRADIALQSEFSHVKDDVAETKQDVKAIQGQLTQQMILLEKINSRLEGP